MKSYKFTIRGHDYEVEILNLESDVAEIEVNGTAYQVEIHREVKKTETPKLVRSVIKNPEGSHEIKKSQDAHITKIVAPLPGTILKLIVAQGVQVKKGDKLLIMEAMKMENEVLAEKDGVVKSVRVQEGSTVLQGDLLVEIE